MKRYDGPILGMAIFLFLGILSIMITLISCKPSQGTYVETPRDTIRIETVRIDTVVDSERIDSLNKWLSQARDSIKIYRDSIPYQDYINARRIEKIKYYISICEKMSLINI